MDDDHLANAQRLEARDLLRRSSVFVEPELGDFDAKDDRELVLLDDAARLSGVYAICIQSELRSASWRIAWTCARMTVQSGVVSTVGLPSSPQRTQPTPYSRPRLWIAIADMRRRPPRYARWIAVTWYCSCAPQRKSGCP